MKSEEAGGAVAGAAGEALNLNGGRGDCGTTMLEVVFGCENICCDDKRGCGCDAGGGVVFMFLSSAFRVDIWVRRSARRSWSVVSSRKSF